MGEYAPKTPHPDYKSCTQCHVPQTTKKLFKETNFVKWMNISNEHEIKQEKVNEL
jgi:hypothetical protein